nr:hypothetical protein [Burkholderia lata]
MAYEKVARNTTFPGFTQRDQVVWIEFEIWMEVERADMVYLELVLAAADFANRMQFQMLRADPRPMFRTGVRDRMLALGNIDEMANDGHKKARSRRAIG